MSWVNVAVAVGSMVMSYSASQQQASVAKAQAQQQALNADYVARQQEQAAGQEIAAAQRQAEQERHRAKLIASRAQAVAGASGAGVSDPAIVNLIADLQGEGAYRAAVAGYQGEERARSLRMGADASRTEGKIAIAGGDARARAYEMQGYGAIVKGVGNVASLYDKYKGDGPPSMRSGMRNFDEDPSFPMGNDAFFK